MNAIRGAPGWARPDPPVCESYVHKREVHLKYIELYF